ncbi:MAG: hypothetical protein EXX96DRAFT_511099, partial [Benjaminiella poitrasii]
MPNLNKNIMFANTIKSDRFSVDFVYNRRNNYEKKAHIDLVLEDFSLDEVDTMYQPMFLDPGRKSIFTAAIGMSPENHSIARCTTKEYYHFTGSIQHLKKLEKLKAESSIKEIETAIPSPKTLSCDVYSSYVDYTLSNITALFSFYGFRTAKSRFHLYQGRQRAPQMMVSMLFNGGTKYNKQKRSKKKKKKKNKKKK